ncbi:MAG TPA: class I SAM-dependent methyltransferase [Leeuwenhoekiella sp.]|nr:class I SAM-dependent methyltransferase [Leeuwenhoekiella sp.]
MLLPRLKNDHIPELKLNDLQNKMKDQVSGKVDKGVYEFEEIACPICSSAKNEVIGEKDRYGLFFKTNICTACGFVYTSPRMTQGAYNQFYNIEYRQLYVGKETATQAFFDGQKQKGKYIYHFLKKNKLIGDNPLFVFEVGCGAGGILDFFRKKGHKVKGIDLGKEYVEYGKNTHNLDLETATLAEMNLAEKPDIIIYSHVLEHILDINEELETIKACSKESTLTYIEVPGIKEVHKNYEANILTYFQNAHTFHFTLETLTNLFTKNGFQRISGNQFVQAVFKQATNQDKIESDYEASKSYILTTEKNRKLYPFTVRGIKRNLQKAVPVILDKTHTRGIARSLKRLLTQNRSN